MDQGKELSARELYNRAYQFHKKHDRENVLDICRILVCNFPMSDEAGWAINRFTLTEQEVAQFTASLPKLIACPDCEKEVSRHAAACPHCNCPLSPQSHMTQRDRPASSPFAIACISAGIVALFTPVLFVNVILVVAIVCGIWSIVKKEPSKMLAVSGLAISVIVFIFANKQMDDVRTKLGEATRELERLQQQIR